jgi:tRNA dimethylallyltransferase
VALIAGPTASGKSALALALAEATQGTLVNADASQVYADLRILTARPSPEEEARAPHLLFGHIDGALACSAAQWAAEARAAIAAIHRQGGLPILVGGTGFYVRTLLDGIAPIPAIDPAIRAHVRALPVAEAHAALAALDPDAARRLPPSDTTRVARALEVARATGRPLAAWHQQRHGGIAEQVRLVPLVLLPPRDRLYARCDARFAAMLDAGAADEVATLRARRLDPALPVMRAIGVREIAAWLDGACDRDTMLAAGQTATRRYAKRQYTWLAHQLPAAWPRHNSQLDEQSLANLVIKLRSMALTD